MDLLRLHSVNLLRPVMKRGNVKCISSDPTICLEFFCFVFGSRMPFDEGKFYGLEIHSEDFISSQ